MEPKKTILYRSRAVCARRGWTVARLGCGLHRYLVLVQQRAAPSLFCTSKSQARKHPNSPTSHLMPVHLAVSTTTACTAATTQGPKQALRASIGGQVSSSCPRWPCANRTGSSGLHLTLAALYSTSRTQCGCRRWREPPSRDRGLPLPCSLLTQQSCRRRRLRCHYTMPMLYDTRVVPSGR